MNEDNKSESEVVDSEQVVAERALNHSTHQAKDRQFGLASTVEAKN